MCQKYNEAEYELTHVSKFYFQNTMVNVNYENYSEYLFEE